MYLLAGNSHLLNKKLGDLPRDIWSWYLDKSGRSNDSNSWQNYTAAYSAAYGSRIPWVTDVGPGLMSTPFKELMAGW